GAMNFFGCLSYKHLAALRLSHSREFASAGAFAICFADKQQQSTQEEKNLLNFAIQTARDAGAILADRLGRALTVSNKGDINLVTEADLASEKLIIERIRSRYPRHSILAEESGAADVINPDGGQSEWRWVVDPLDGTTNYAHGYPCFCVSIGLERAGRLELGVVYDPNRDEMF